MFKALGKVVLSTWVRNRLQISSFLRKISRATRVSFNQGIASIAAFWILGTARAPLITKRIEKAKIKSLRALAIIRIFIIISLMQKTQKSRKLWDEGVN